MASTFYTLQGANRRNSLLLMLSVALILGVLGFAIGYGSTGQLSSAMFVTTAAVIVAGLLSLISYYRGDSMVLAASKARQVTEADAPQLMNVVREMAIAANLPMPKVYVIDDSAPNAFATGRDPEHASIAVTTGLLDKLNREELQGVIGHELGHVGNYDIRFALLVGVLVGSIALMADVFLRWTWWSGFGGRSRSRDRDGGGAGQAIIFVVAIVLAILAPLFARMVQLAVSRQREYLADATAVEFTRNPAGLERALSKIAGDTEVLEVANRATQHLYIVNPIKKFEERSKGMFSTHPPIVERINRLRSLHGAAPLTSTEAGTLANLD
ncbi:MAG: M48 family metallopeptidase [Dehalococcoidia bacterium]